MVEAKLDCEATTISVSWKKPEEGTMTGYRVTCLTKEEVEKEKENKEKEGKKQVENNMMSVLSSQCFMRDKISKFTSQKTVS